MAYNYSIYFNGQLVDETGHYADQEDAARPHEVKVAIQIIRKAKLRYRGRKAFWKASDYIIRSDGKIHRKFY
jgi:hypothetical protein